MDTCQQFLDMFQESGLQPGVLSGCYGLAESCVFVGSETRLRMITNKADGKPRVCCSNVDHLKCLVDIDIRVIDPDTGKEVLDGTVGEICVSSKSVAGGYYGQPERSRDTFQFKIVGDNSGKDFLRTGDLGLIDKPDLEWCLSNRLDVEGLENPEADRKEMNERHLIITGREKDLIIVRGKNFYPQEIESAAECAMNPEKILREGCSVAFSVDEDGNDTEILAVVIEIREAGMKAFIKSRAPLTALDTYKFVCNTIAQKISVDEGVLPSIVVLIEEKTIPKTTSGKVQRRKTKACLLDNSLKTVYRWENKTAGRNFNVNNDELPDNRNIPAVAIKGEEVDEDTDESLKSEIVLSIERDQAGTLRSLSVSQLSAVAEGADEEEKQKEEVPLRGESDIFHSAITGFEEPSTKTGKSTTSNRGSIRGSMRGSMRASVARSSVNRASGTFSKNSVCRTRASSSFVKSSGKPRQRNMGSLQVQIMDLLQKQVPEANMVRLYFLNRICRTPSINSHIFPETGRVQTVLALR